MGRPDSCSYQPGRLKARRISGAVGWDEPPGSMGRRISAAAVLSVCLPAAQRGHEPSCHPRAPQPLSSTTLSPSRVPGPRSCPQGMSPALCYGPGTQVPHLHLPSPPPRTVPAAPGPPKGTRGSRAGPWTAEVGSASPQHTVPRSAPAGLPVSKGCPRASAPRLPGNGEVEKERKNHAVIIDSVTESNTKISLDVPGS